MKKLLVLTSAMALATVVSYGQGTVAFANASTQFSPADNTHLATWGGTAADFNPLLTGGGLVSSNYAGVIMPNLVAQLYYGPASATSLSSLTAVTAAPANFRSSTSANAGSWLGGTRTLTTAQPGDALKLAVVIWDNTGGVNPITSDGSAVKGILWGTSGLFNYTVPAVGSPASAYNMFNLPAFSVGFVPVPEPTSLALAGLGLAGLLIFRRRK